MTIWDSICHSQWFKQTSIVLIIFREASCFILTAGLYSVLDPVPEQDRRVQEQVAQGAAGEVFSGVHGGSGYQQGGQVYIVAVHAGE